MIVTHKKRTPIHVETDDYHPSLQVIMSSFSSRENKRKRTDADNDDNVDVAVDDNKNDDNDDDADGGTDGDYETPAAPDAAIAADADAHDNAVIPDRAQSISNYHLQYHEQQSHQLEELSLLFPNDDEDEMPTSDQLADILTYIESSQNWRHSNDNVLKVLARISSCFTKHCNHNDNSDDDTFRLLNTSFVELGGVVRMIRLIEKRMDNPNFVRDAANTCDVSLSSVDSVDSSVSVGSSKFIFQAAFKSISRRGRIRVLLLALEELQPSKTTLNWQAAISIWSIISSLFTHHKSDGHIIPRDDIIRVVDTCGQFLVMQAPPPAPPPHTHFDRYRMMTLEHIVSVLYVILDVPNNDTMIHIFQEKKCLDHIHNFCIKNKSLWLQEYKAVVGVVDLCYLCAYNNMSSNDDDDDDFLK
jgi:hypothetical protein